MFWVIKGAKTMRTFLIAAISLAVVTGSALAGDAKNGQSVYEKNCKSCHGPNGAAPPNVATMQQGRIKDLRSSPIQSMSDADLAKVVTEGKGKMTSAKAVSGPALDDLIAYIRTLKS
jgi:mono/diheme cytochrome c family protein